MLEIRLLGEPMVMSGGSPIEVDTQKAIAVLAYLVVEETASRDSLAFLLWADSPAKRARATLRRTLSALRTGIGTDHLFSDRTRVGLTGEFDADVREFRAAISSTHTHGHEAADVCPTCIQPLRRAAELYRGDFLATFSVRGAPDFEDWARTVAEVLRVEAGGVFQRLASGLAASGDYDGAIAAVARWIDIDPLHEPAHRQLMLLNAWAGNRPGAIEAYRACVAILDEELGVSPLEETSELYEAVLEEDLPPAPAMPRRPKSHPTTKGLISEMFGRSAEMDRVVSHLSPSTGGLVMIEGGPWMGKTRLLEETAHRAQALGFQVVVGRASRFEQTIPYGVLIQLLEPMLARLTTSHTDIEPWARDELSRLLPRLAPGQPVSEPDRLGDLRLLEAIGHVFDKSAEINTMLVAIDDAQWLDSASLRAIENVVSRKAVSPVFMITVAPAATASSIRDLFETASEVIELAPLSAESLDGIDPANVDEIVSGTGGIPLLVQEFIQQGSSSPSVGRYVESRLRLLSDLARQVLGAAAVVGSQVDPTVLRETSGRSEEELVDAVEELIQSGLVRELPDGPMLGFTVEAAQAAAYQAMSLVRRRLLHRRAAEALQAMPRAATDARIASTIAEHYAAAGHPSASDWYRTAGDLARLSYADQEAVSFYESAIALGYPDVSRLHLAVGELALARGDYQAALAKLRTAASRAEGTTLGEIEHRIGEVHRLMGRFDLAEQSFARASTSHPRPALLYAEWALLHHRRGDAVAADAAARASLGLATQSGEPTEVARAHNVLAVIENDRDKAMGHVEAALASAVSEPEVMAALNNRARLLAEIGEYEAATVTVQEAITAAGRTGHRHRQAALLNRLADIHHLAGRDEEAESALKDAVTLFADIDSSGWEPELWLISHW